LFDFSHKALKTDENFCVIQTIPDNLYRGQHDEMQLIIAF